MIALRAAFLGILFAVAAQASRADHFPENLRASDPPDRVLSGVHVGEDRAANLASAIRALGHPYQYKEQPHSDPIAGGAAEYRWRRSGVEIAVETVWHFDRNGHRVEFVVSCSIDGAASTAPFCSARGVCLGDNVRAIEKQYGRKYVRDTLADHDQIRYQFLDDTDLEFDIGKTGGVQRIRLAASLE